MKRYLLIVLTVGVLLTAFAPAAAALDEAAVISLYKNADIVIDAEVSYLQAYKGLEEIALLPRKVFKGETNRKSYFIKMPYGIKPFPYALLFYKIKGSKLLLQRAVYGEDYITAKRIVMQSRSPQIPYTLPEDIKRVLDLSQWLYDTYTQSGYPGYFIGSYIRFTEGRPTLVLGVTRINTTIETSMINIMGLSNDYVIKVFQEPADFIYEMYEDFTVMAPYYGRTPSFVAESDIISDGKGLSIQIGMDVLTNDNITAFKKAYINSPYVKFYQTPADR